MTQQHQLSEFHPNANGRRACRFANKHLAELAITTDKLWTNVLTAAYLRMLEVGHKLGTEASLIAAHQADVEAAADAEAAEYAQAQAEADALVPVIRRGMRKQFRGQQAYKCLHDSLSQRAVAQ